GVSYKLSSASAVLTLAVDRLYDLRTAQPYNPASGAFGTREYTLTAPDGTLYYLSTLRGVEEEVLPGGTQLIFSDTGIVSSSGDAVSFVHDAQGRLSAMIAGDGTTVLYSYDSNGNLVSARNVALGQSSRYGYSSASPHQLDVVVQPGGVNNVV